MTLDFTCTAMCRADVFRRTLESFAGQLRGVALGASTMFLNIDPMPDGDTGEVVAVAQEFFGSVVVNAPSEPCFPAAVKWCWAQPTSEYLFHAEDDWICTKPVEIAEMLALLQADPSLSLVNLRAYKQNDDRLCLAPGLWRTAHARAIGERLRADVNPERQLRPGGPSNPHGGAHAGYKGKQYPDEIVLKDLGRAWMTQNGLKRAGDRNFVRWVETRKRVMV